MRTQVYSIKRRRPLQSICVAPIIEHVKRIYDGRWCPWSAVISSHTVGIFYEAGDEDVKQATILIGDGRDNSRRQLKALLTRSGYLVEAEAGNAPELLRRARTMYPDLVIMDSSLEGGSIPEIAGIIEGDGLSSVLVLVQGSPERIPAEVAHIQKPYTEETLLAVIDVLLLYQNRLASVQEQVTTLKETLRSRKLIEKAKGILMKNLNIDETAAYRTMQKESMNRSISMRELAQAVITAFGAQD